MKTLLTIIILIAGIAGSVGAQSFKSLELNPLSFGYCGQTNRIYIGGLIKGDTEYYYLKVIDASTIEVLDSFGLDHEVLEIEISENCEFLYISYKDEPLIQRYLLPSLELDLSIGLPSDGNDPLFATDIEIFNTNPEAIAFVLNDLSIIGPEKGIAVYVNNSQTGFQINNNITEIELAEDDTYLYGYNSTSTSHTVSAIELVDNNFGDELTYYDLIETSTSDHIALLNNRLFFSNGTILEIQNDSLWLSNEEFSVNATFNDLIESKQFSKIYTIADNLYFHQRVISVDAMAPTEPDTIFFPFGLGLDASLVLDEIKPTNCNNGFIVSARNLNTHLPYEIGLLVIYNPNIINQQQLICEGDSVFFNNQYYSQPGYYVDTSNYEPGNCNTLQQLDIQVISTEYYFSQTFCEEYTVIIEGQEITESGIYTFNHVNQLGCDSINIYDVEILEMEEIVIDTFGYYGDQMYWITLTSDTTLISEINPPFGCDYTIIYNIDLLTSVNELIEQSILIYPNPVLGKVTIESQSAIDQVELFSINGVLIREVNNSISNIITMDVSNIEEGLFYLKVTSNGITQIRKVLKL